MSTIPESVIKSAIASLPQELRTLIPTGWYRGKNVRAAGDVFHINGMPVAVVAIKSLDVASEWNADAGEYGVADTLLLRGATAEELAVANAGRAAAKAGAPDTDPRRVAAKAQRAAIRYTA